MTNAPTRDTLRSFLASKKQTEAQIDQIDQHIMTLATTSICGYSSIAYGLIDLLTDSKDAPALASVHEATQMLEAITQAHAATQTPIGELSEAIKQIASWGNYATGEPLSH